MSNKMPKIDAEIQAQIGKRLYDLIWEVIGTEYHYRFVESRGQPPQQLFMFPPDGEIVPREKCTVEQWEAAHRYYQKTKLAVAALLLHEYIDFWRTKGLYYDFKVFGYDGVQFSD